MKNKVLANKETLTAFFKGVDFNKIEVNEYTAGGFKIYTDDKIPKGVLVAYDYNGNMKVFQLIEVKNEDDKQH